MFLEVSLWGRDVGYGLLRKCALEGSLVQEVEGKYISVLYTFELGIHGGTF